MEQVVETPATVDLAEESQKLLNALNFSCSQSPLPLFIIIGIIELQKADILAGIKMLSDQASAQQAANEGKVN